MTENISAIDTLKRFYAAETHYVASGGTDFSAIAETLDADCVLYVPESLSYGGTWRGHEGFEAWSKGFSEKWSGLEVTEPEFYSVEDRVFVLSTCRATVRSNGKALSWPLTQVYKIRNGKIAELRAVYWDTAAILKTMAEPA
jgi:ketosteroid isomerase-like protein